MNSKVYVMVGYGPGIGHATSLKFGREGFRVAILCRTMTKVRNGVQNLSANGIDVKGYQCDATDESQVIAVFKQIGRDLGRIDVLHYNPELWHVDNPFDVSKERCYEYYDLEVIGLLKCIQNAIGYLEKVKGCVLVTNGGLAEYKKNQKFSKMYLKKEIPQHSMMFAVNKAAQQSLVYGLQPFLRQKDVTIYSILVDGPVFDKCPVRNKTNIAELFWSAYKFKRFNTETVHSKL